MPKLLVCYKWVLDEQDIKINSNDLSLDTSRAKSKISDFDRNAIEEATLIVEKHGGSLEALTFGTPAVKQSLKDVLSRGPNKVYWIGDALAEKADAYVISTVLAAAIRKLEPCDLIVCGEGSSDLYNQQIASRIAALLDLPVVTCVQQIALDAGGFTATRKLSDCTEVVSVRGPAVISVLGEINKPRIPSLKQVLAATRKPSQEIKVAEFGLTAEQLKPRVVSTSVKGFVMCRKNIVFREANVADNVAKLVASLAQEGLCRER